MSQLKKIGGVFYGQVVVPLELQSVIGAKTKERSLRTKDFRKAKVLLLDFLSEWYDRFEAARNGVEHVPDDRAKVRLTDAQMAARLYKSELELDQAIRASDHAYARREVDADVARQFRDGFSGKLSNTELQEIIGDRVEFFRTKGFHDHTEGSGNWRTLAQALCAARYEVMAREAERQEGDYTGRPQHPTITSAPPEPERAASGETIMELFAIYEGENPRSISTDTLNQARRDIGTFVDHVGKACPVRGIDKKAVREWKALLMKYPVKATETKVFAGLKMAQIVKKNEKEKKPVLTPRTVNRYLSSLGAFCNWLVGNGYLDQNPTADMSLAKKKEASTLPFSVEQMNVLFKTPIFTGAQSADEWRLIAKPGNIMIRDHRYWVPLIMLFSGARPAEIAQLDVADVREAHGHWIFHITTEGDGDKNTKTSGSMRVVPVHPELLKLGFLEYYASKKESGETRLFPEAVRNMRGQMIAEFSREFGRYLTRLGIKSGRGLSLYSFRHGIADALRRAGYLDENFGYILGHTKGTMTGRYGHLPQGMLEQRVDLINSIAYPDLDLEHLYIVN